MRRSALLLLTALTLASVGACSDDDGDGDGDEAVASTATVVDDATSTTGARGTTSTSARAVCEAAEVPAPRGELTYIGAELDGDDEGDTAYTTLADDGWHLRADLGDGGTADELLTTSPSDEANVESVRDLDGDGTDELWVVVGNGASARIVGLFDLDGCDLEAVQLGGSPAEFAVGGPVLLLQGVRCEADGRVTHLGATSEDGESFTTLDLTYELRGGELVRVADASGALTSADAELAAYSTFDC